MEKKNLKIELCGERLDNPVIGASGVFGYGGEYADFYDINMLGTFSMKGTTLKPRYGNAMPRIAECKAGLINSVGLENPGIDKVIEECLPNMKKDFQKKVIANISGFSEEEYPEIASKFNDIPEVGWLELNVSCPNVNHGGMALGTDEDTVSRITYSVKEVSPKPVIVKLTPNVTDITRLALACERAGADALALVNTFMAMRIDLKSRRPVLANGAGGYSGPGIFPMALRMVYQTYEKAGIPIIGIGGITSAGDVIEMMMAGAAAVEVGAANMVDPYACKKIIEELPSVMEEYGIDDINEIVGGAHNG
ncbi:MAG: dihydroorotate dehydrogenase [Clostridiales bacterium]|nr:dihydroorotate dehydrogenase [Clostridiales bacterium]